MFRQRKSYRYAGPTHKAFGLLVASFLALSLLDPAPLAAHTSDENADPLDNHCAPIHRWTQTVKRALSVHVQTAGGSQHDAQTSLWITELALASQTLVKQGSSAGFFAASDKFAIFEVRLRQTRDPPDIAL